MHCRLRKDVDLGRQNKFYFPAQMLLIVLAFFNSNYEVRKLKVVYHNMILSVIS